jgi:hypothetical protein
VEKLNQWKNSNLNALEVTRQQWRHEIITSVDLYIDECMLSIINIHTVVKELTYGYQNCNTNQIHIFDGYVKMRESLNTQVIIRINTILH